MTQSQLMAITESANDKIEKVETFRSDEDLDTFLLDYKNIPNQRQEVL